MSRRVAARVVPAALAALVLNAALFAAAALLARERPLRFEMSEPVSVNLLTLRPPPAPGRKEVRPEKRPEPEPEQRDSFVPDLRLPRPLRPDLPALSVDIDGDALRLPPLGGDLVFNAEDLDQPPRELTRTEPSYPFRASERGIEGAVQVKFLVGADGGVSRIEILSAEPAGVFEDAVLRAVPSWRYEPGQLDGRAVPSWVATTITFEMDRGP